MYGGAAPPTVAGALRARVGTNHGGVGLMIRLAELSIRYPKRVLAFCIVVAAIAAVFAFGIGDQLSPSKTIIPGTESARAAQVAQDEFGQSVLVPILLQGPAAQIDIQGPKLVTALR